MRKLKPPQYIAEFYPGACYTTKTIINWIKAGKLKGEQTPTGRWLVLVNDQNSTKVNDMLAMLEAAGS